MIRTAQEDHPYILEWLARAANEGGGFLRGFACAALVADWENYPLIRPTLQVLIQKYPRFKPSDEVKRELKQAADDWMVSAELNAAVFAESLFK